VLIGPQSRQPCAEDEGALKSEEGTNKEHFAGCRRRRPSFNWRKDLRKRPRARCWMEKGQSYPIRKKNAAACRQTLPRGRAQKTEVEF